MKELPPCRLIQLNAGGRANEPSYLWQDGLAIRPTVNSYLPAAEPASRIGPGDRLESRFAPPRYFADSGSATPRWRTSHHLGTAGGGGILAAASLAATGDSGGLFTEESSEQPVIAAANTGNIKTRNARCMEISSVARCPIVTSGNCRRGPRGSRQR